MDATDSVTPIEKRILEPVLSTAEGDCCDGSQTSTPRHKGGDGIAGIALRREEGKAGRRHFLATVNVAFDSDQQLAAHAISGSLITVNGELSGTGGFGVWDF